MRLGPSLLLVAACGAPMAPEEQQLERIQPDAAFRAEWDWTWATCASRWVARPRARWEEISWYRVLGGDGFRFFEGGALVDGRYRPGAKAIDLPAYAARTDYGRSDTALTVSWIRRHEMLHAQAGRWDHPAGLFPACEDRAVNDWKATLAPSMKGP